MADDPDLEAIRQQRIAQMKAQQAARGGGQGGEDQQREAAERKQKEEEFRNSILSQVLSQEARARLATLAAAKPEKAKMVENMIIHNARMGVLPGKITEEQLKDILGRVSQQTQKQTTVKYDRRRAGLDDDDDEEIEESGSNRRRHALDDDDDDDDL